MRNNPIKGKQKRFVNMVVDQGRKLIAQTHAGFRDHDNAGMGLQVNETFLLDNSFSFRLLNDNLYGLKAQVRHVC